MNKLYFILNIIILNNLILNAQNLYDFSVYVGPTFIKQYPNYSSDYNGTTTEFNYTQKLSNKSSLIFGTGILLYNKTRNYTVDTNFQYVGSTTGCNCRYYYSKSTFTQLYFPIKYKLSLVKKKNFEISSSIGFELFWYLKSAYSNANYRRLRDGSLDMGPYYVDINILKMKSETRRLKVSTSFGLGFRRRLYKQLFAISNFSINRRHDFKTIRILFGISIIKDKYSH